MEGKYFSLSKEEILCFLSQATSSSILPILERLGEEELLRKFFKLKPHEIKNSHWAQNDPVLREYLVKSGAKDFQYLVDPTEEECLRAIEINPSSYQYFPTNRCTKKMNKHVLKRDPYKINYIVKPSIKEILYVLQKNFSLLSYVENQLSTKDQLKIIETFPNKICFFLEEVDWRNLEKEVADRCVELDGLALHYIAFPTFHQIKTALKQVLSKDKIEYKIEELLSFPSWFLAWKFESYLRRKARHSTCPKITLSFPQKIQIYSIFKEYKKNKISKENPNEKAN